MGGLMVTDAVDNRPTTYLCLGRGPTIRWTDRSDLTGFPWAKRVSNWGATQDGKPWSHACHHAKTPFYQGGCVLKPKKAPAKKPAAKKATKKAVKKPQGKKTASRPAKKPPAKKKTTVRPKAQSAPQSDLLQRIVASLDEDKAENIITIDLEGRSALCDAAVIASGRSSRHVAAIADHLARRLKESGYGTRPVTGATQGDWVLVDAGDIIVHIFRPEVRDYYDLEGMWNVEAPGR
jgi:ribosome-associated protein